MPTTPQDINSYTYNGSLLINVTSTLALLPIDNAKIVISYTGENNNILDELSTDSSGQSPIISLPAPNPELSQFPQEIRPYSEYDITVSASGYYPLTITGSQIFAGSEAIQNIRLTPMEFTGTAYQVSLSTDGINFQLEKTPTTSNTKLTNRGDWVIGTMLSDNRIFLGEIDITDWVIKVNGNIWWKGVETV